MYEPITIDKIRREILLLQLGKLQAAELKISELKLALSGQSLAHTRVSLQTVTKTAVVDLFFIIFLILPDFILNYNCDFAYEMVQK